MTKEALSELDVQMQARRARRLLKHVWKHFQEDRCLEEAASLSYTSLLAMVPLLAVVFGIIAAFPVFNKWSDNLQSFIFSNFMPSTGEVIAPYLDTFLDSVSSLTLPGTVMLIVTALLLMVRIEVAFNRIWRVERNRTLVNRIVMYWAVLTLAPILIATTVAISATQLLGSSSLQASLSPGLYQLGIFILTWMVFAVVFVLVPNRSVRIKHALMGAFLSAVLFGLTKAGFVAYVSNTNYKVIYGALATVPIFLFWIYLVWNVILFGASLAASLTTFSDYSRYETSWPKRWEFQMAFRLVEHFWRAQREGRPLTLEQLLELEQRASELQLLKLVSRMCEENILSMTEEGVWVLARDIEDFTLGDLYQLGDYYLPLGELSGLPRDSAIDQAYIDSLEHVRANGHQAWDQSLRHMFLEADTKETEKNA